MPEHVVKAYGSFNKQALSKCAEEAEARRSKERLAMSEPMLAKYGGNGLGEKPKSDASSEIILDAEEITERVMQKMVLGGAKKDNGTDYSGLVI